MNRLKMICQMVSAAALAIGVTNVVDEVIVQRGNVQAGSLCENCEYTGSFPAGPWVSTCFSEGASGYTSCEEGGYRTDCTVSGFCTSS